MLRQWYAGALLAGLLISSQLTAQEHNSRTAASAGSPALSLGGGVSHFDLSGTGTAPLLELRGNLPLTRVLIVEGGFTMAWPEQQFGERTTLLIPEVELQFQVPRRVAPYFGVGTGFLFDFRGEDHGGTIPRFVYSASGGLRVGVTRRMGARAQLRIRSVGATFGGSMADWTIGATWRL